MQAAVLQAIKAVLETGSYLRWWDTVRVLLYINIPKIKMFFLCS